MISPPDLPAGSDAAFEYETLPSSVVFGTGRLTELGAVLERFGITRALLIDGLQGSAIVARTCEVMGTSHLATIHDVRPHVPVVDADSARARARELRADGIVALGGGSAIGLAKAIALTDGLPIVAIPTTYAGSEMTPIWGMTSEERKRTGRDPRVLPKVVIYDPELTYSLPPAATAASGMNAVAHCVEGLWTAQATPASDAFAAEGLRLLAVGLPGAVAEPGSSLARATALRGAWLAGATLANAGTGTHHRLCHVLGGFGLPHAEVHTALLPEVTALLLPAAGHAETRIAGALGAPDAVAGLRELISRLGPTPQLDSMGLTAAQAREAAELAAASAPAHPRPVTSEELLDVLLAAGAPLN